LVFAGKIVNGFFTIIKDMQRIIYPGLSKAVSDCLDALLLIVYKKNGRNDHLLLLGDFVHWSAVLRMLSCFSSASSG